MQHHSNPPVANELSMNQGKTKETVGDYVDFFGDPSQLLTQTTRQAHHISYTANMSGISVQWPNLIEGSSMGAACCGRPKIGSILP
jgi:hypothetical protein